MKLGKTALMSVVCAAALAAPRKAALRPLLRERFEGRARGKLAMALFLPLISILPLLLPFTAQAAIHLGSPNTVSLSQGLVGYWPLDGPVTNWNTNTTADLSGNGNTGQLVSMSTSSSPTAGKIGQALKFDGSSSYISAGVITALSGLQKATMSAWQYYTPTSDESLFMGTSGTDNSDRYRWTINWFSNDGIYCTAENGSVAYNGGPYIGTVGWHHVVAVFDGSQVLEYQRCQIYVDGVALAMEHGQGSLATSLASGGNEKPFEIGRSFADPEMYGYGLSDDVRIYNRALSAQEVQQLYHQGAANIAHSNVGISNGLVGYWTFDGGSIDWRKNQMTDMSGNGNTGQPVSMSTSSSPTAGKIGQALNFDNTSTYVQLPSIASSNQTISAWVNRRSLADGTDPDWVDAILYKGSDDHNGFFGMYIDGIASETPGNLYAYLRTAASGVVYCDSGVQAVQNKWYLVTATKDGSNIRVYVDGKLGNTCAYSGTDTNSYQWFIGKEDDPGYPYQFDGKMDDVRIYNRALSGQEVQQLYHQGAANIAHSNVGISDGLVVYWTMDGGSIDWSKNQMTDMSGNGNTGQLIYMSTSTSPIAGKIGQAL